MFFLLIKEIKILDVAINISCSQKTRKQVWLSKNTGGQQYTDDRKENMSLVYKQTKDLYTAEFC